MNTVGEIVDILTQDKDKSHSDLYASRDEALQQMEAVILPPEGAKPREDTATTNTLCWSPPEVMYVMYTSGSTGKPKVIRRNIQKSILLFCSRPVFIYSLSNCILYLLRAASCRRVVCGTALDGAREFLGSRATILLS